MSRPQAHVESQSGGFLDEIVTFVVNVVEVTRDWISSLWYPSVPTSETTQVKDALKQASVAQLPKDLSTSPNVPSASNDESNPLLGVGTSGNTDDSSILQENQLSSPATHDLEDATIAAKVDESKDEVPLVQGQDVEQAEPTTNTHEISVENDSSQEWVSLSKPDTESPSTNVPTPSEHEDPLSEGSPSQQEVTVEPTLVDSPTIPQESATGSDTSSLPLSTPEPDTQSFDHAAIRIPDAEEQAPLNPESNVESGSVGIKARSSTPSLDDSASIPINQSDTGSTSELPTKKQRGSSFIKKQTTLMSKVFKSGNGKDARTNLTSPSKASLTVDNQSINSSFVSEPEAMEHSTPVPDVSLADAPIDKKIASPSRVSLRSIGSIKKKFGRRGSTASDKDVVSAPDQESRPGTPESLNLPSNSGQPSKVADATSSGPSLLKTMFKVRKPLNVDELRT